MASARDQDPRSSASSATSDEKGHVTRTGTVDDGKLNPPLFNAHIDVSGVDEKKLLRKMDWWLVPWLSFLYLLSFLDRTSIGNAKVRALLGITLARAPLTDLVLSSTD